MRTVAVALTTLFLLFAAGNAVAGAEERAEVPPRQFDWSVTEVLNARHSLYTDAQPLLRDGEGNYHQVSFVPDGQDIFRLKHTVVDREGEELSSAVAEIPGLTEYATVAVVPQGLLVVWAAYEVIPTEDVTGEVRLFAATVDWEGKVLNQSELNYSLPSGTPGQDLDRFEMIWRLFVVVDNDDNIHLTAQAGDRQFFRIYYFKFDAQFRQSRADWTQNNSVPNWLLGGDIVLDGEGNAYILYSIRENIWLAKFSAAGEKMYEEQVAKQVFVFGNEPSSEYSRRGRAPAMAVDDRGTVHIAYNHLVQAGMGREIVDVNYIQVRDGQVTEEKTLSTGTGRFRFPTMTLVDERIAITWEQPLGPGQQQLIFTTLTLDGDVLLERVNLTFDDGFASSGLVWAHPDNHFSAAWWQGIGSNRQVAYKSTFNPVELTMWHQFGVIDDFSNQGPVEQVAYWFAMVLLLAGVRLFANLHVIVIVAGGLYVLYRLQLLEPLQSRSWQLLAVMLLVCFVLVQPLEVAERVAGEGYYLFSSLAATLLVVACSLLLKVKYHSSLNLLSGCLAWLYLVGMIQVMPVVPNLLGI